jgi:hypothetical protein
MGIAGGEFGPGVADADYRLFSIKKVVRESLVFHPGSVDDSVFSGAAVPFLTTEFLLGHRLERVVLFGQEDTKKLDKWGIALGKCGFLADFLFNDSQCLFQGLDINREISGN